MNIKQPLTIVETNMEIGRPSTVGVGNFGDWEANFTVVAHSASQPQQLSVIRAIIGELQQQEENLVREIMTEFKWMANQLEPIELEVDDEVVGEFSIGVELEEEPRVCYEGSGCCCAD